MNNLLPRKEKDMRSSETQSKLLRFMYYEPYTTANVVQTLIGYKTLSAALKLLKRVEKKGLVKRHILNNLSGRPLSFWGSTVAGLAAIYDPNKMAGEERERGFRTDQIYLTTLDHLNKTQLLKCKMLNSEREINFLHINNKIWDTKVPDILISEKRGENKISIYAYEVELTIKSERRYIDIINEYKTMINKNQCNYIYWCADTAQKKEKLEAIFQRNSANEHGQHHQFRTLDELKI